MYSIVFVAGYQNSEPEHWQRLWHKKMQNSYFVEQDNWDSPKKEEWIKRLNETLQKIEGEVVLVAHSMGCCTVAQWAANYKNEKVVAALLVAIPDVLQESFPKEIVGFDNSPVKKLPFPSIAVISENDPYASVKRSEEIAAIWGCESLHVGKKGHINLASSLGEWEEGQEILKKLTCKK